LYRLNNTYVILSLISLTVNTINFGIIIIDLQINLVDVSVSIITMFVQLIYANYAINSYGN